MADQQRTPVPFNRNPPRRRNGRGGVSVPLPRYEVTPGMTDDATRYPGAANDGRILRDHTGWYPTDRVSSAGDSWVNWTAAGPPRPELHMRHTDWRVMAGTSSTRFLANPLDPKVGLHTDPKVPALGTIQRYAAQPALMTTARQDRLLSGQYNGQSYSQTTRPQGAGGPRGRR